MVASFPSQDEADTIFQRHAASKLRQALHLPSTSPTIAHWLFAHSTLPFHPDLPLLPPTAFTTALAISVSDLFTHFHPTSSNPFECPFPTDAYFGSASGRPPPPELTAKADVQLLFVPAKVDAQFALGYSLSVHTCADAKFIPFNVESYEPQMKGRFVFDRSNRKLLCVLPNLAPSAAGIISLQTLHNNRRARAFFTVPRYQYSYDYLPSKVLALVSNVEYKVENATLSQFARPKDDCVDLTSGVQAPADDLETWANNLMHAAENGRVSEQSSALRLYMGDSAQRNDAFNMDAVSQSLAELEGVMGGKYFAPRLNKDVMHPITGEITNRTTGELRASFEAIAPVELNMIREIAAQMYYASTMAVSADSALSVSVNKHPLMLEGPCEMHGGKRARIGETTLAPKPVMGCMHCQQGVAFPAPVTMNEEEVKEMKKEAKRRKNRLSAARSNQRRKERVLAQQKELEQLKEKLVELKGVEERLRNENLVLKSQAAG